jgi:two-component system sensor histidine kinase HydH
MMMKWRKSSIKRVRLLEYSPWILAFACMLLLLLLAVFAVNNFRREKALVNFTLEQKALTLVRFITSSVREAVRTDLRRGSDKLSWKEHMQAALDQAVEQPGVTKVVIVDSTGSTLAEDDQSQQDKRELTLDERELLQKIGQEGQHPWISRLVDNGWGELRQFIVAARYFPPMAGGPGPQRSMARGFSNHSRFKKIEAEMQGLRDLQPIIIVELDFAEFDSPLKRQYLQIVLQLVVIMLVGIGGTLSFLTLRGLKGTERSLGRARAFTESMVSSLPIGLLATNSEGVIQVCNSVAEDILEISRGELLYSPAREVLAPELAKNFTGLIGDAHGVSQSELILDFSGGRVKSLHIVSKQVEDLKGEFSGKVLILQDLSEIKYLEKELHKSERLAALGKMAAGVAHEIRNPLSSIKGLALLLQTSFDHGSQEYSNVDTLVKEVERLNRSIGELLDFAKPAQLSRFQVDIKEILAKTIRLVALDASSYNISIKLIVDDQLSPVAVDPDKLSQVFLNLLLNSIQALSVADRRQKEISITLQKNNNLLQITVADNGIGMAPEVVKKAFDPYFTTKNEGTGLGLSLSAKIIEEHGGRMEIESVAGESAKVKVVLPLSMDVT